MEKPVAIIEISDSCARLLIGDVVNDKAAVICTAEKPVSGLISRGEPLDYIELQKVIASLSSICDDNLKLRVKVSEATILLPPIGFTIFQLGKSTTCSSSTGHVQQLDFANLLHQMKNETIPQGSILVDVVPTLFVLDGGRTFTTPPLGEQSKSIAASAMIHTVPYKVYHQYTDMVEEAGIRCKKTLMSPYTICELVKRQNDMPLYYVLVNISDGYTSLTLVNKHNPFDHNYFAIGFNDLVMKVSQELQVSEEKAKELIRVNGISERQLSFEPPLVTSLMEDGTTKTFTPNDLNKIISEFFEQYFVNFEACHSSLVNKPQYKENVRKLPFIICGELSTVKGFDKIIREKYQSVDNVIYLCPKEIGARDTNYCSLVGALYEAATFKGSWSEQKAIVNPVGRVNEQK